MAEKAKWLIWDIDDAMWWHLSDNGLYTHTNNRKKAERFTLTEARKLVEAVNDPANDPTAAIVPE